MVCSEVAARIEELRLKGEYTHDDMAEVLSCHRTTYTRKVNGKSQFTLEELTILADFFNVDLSYIQTGCKVENVDAHKHLGLSDQEIEVLKRTKSMGGIFSNPNSTGKLFNDLLNSRYYASIHHWYSLCVQRRERVRNIDSITPEDRERYFAKCYAYNQDADATSRGLIMRGNRDEYIKKELREEYDFALFKLTDVIMEAVRDGVYSD